MEQLPSSGTVVFFPNILIIKGYVVTHLLCNSAPISTVFPISSCLSYVFSSASLAVHSLLFLH